ncbi:MAG: PAS domain S-box protein [Glaciimonas sp.]|nr:PAS domain S-box protein [Glaciimonas sp.]
MILKTLSPEAAQLMFQELRARQNELELQNAQLHRAQAKLDVERAHYFALYDLAPVAYCILGAQGLILQANLAAASLLEVTGAALVNQPFMQFIVKADQDTYCRYRTRVLASSEAQSCELRMAKNDGRQFWVHLQTSVAQDADGAPALRTVLTDLTQRKQAEAELAAIQSIAENASQTEAHFLAAIRHDFRQPLSALGIYANVLKIHVAPTGQPLLANMKDCIASLNQLLSKTDGPEN